MFGFRMSLGSIWIHDSLLIVKFFTSILDHAPSLWPPLPPLLSLTIPEQKKVNPNHNGILKMRLEL